MKTNNKDTKNEIYDKYIDLFCKKEKIILLNELLGSGAYGKVYQGIMNDTYPVAIKIIIIHEKDTNIFEKMIKKYKIEGNISMNLKHQGIIKSFLVKTMKNPDNSILYAYIMEKATNKNLSIFTQELNKTNYYNLQNHSKKFKYIWTISENIIKYFIYQILEGLEYMYRNNIVHFDVKPENILINRKFRTKICDFSNTDDCNLNTKDTNETFILKDSTQSYMGPEYYTESKSIPSIYGNRPDIFSVGLIIYYMIFRKHLVDNKIGNVTFEQVNKNINFIKDEIINYKFISYGCKNLLLQLIDNDYSKRPNIYECMNNIWLTKSSKYIDYVYENNMYIADQKKLFLELQKSFFCKKLGKKVRFNFHTIIKKNNKKINKLNNFNNALNISYNLLNNYFYKIKIRKF